MREILFKAKPKNKGNEDFVFGYVWDNNCGNTFIRRTVNLSGRIVVEDVEVYSETVCQYTGLTDKNGVKIFEGDRCVFHGEEYSDPYKVFWDAEDCRWSVKDETCGATDSLDWFFAENCTVIGNIHDDE